MNISTQKKLHNGIIMPVPGFGVFRMDEDQTLHAVGWALEAGYRHIDTARYYKNERAVGRAVKASGLPREDLFVTTKLWNDDIRSGRQKAAFEESLRDLDMDYVDLYLIHWPVGDIMETWKAMEDIFASGKAKAVGVSNFQPHHIDALLEKSSLVPAVNQIEIHPYLSQQELVDYNAQHGIATQAWSPIGGQNNVGPEVKKDPVILRLAEKHGKTPVQIILRWHVQRGVVPLPKSVNRDRIDANRRIFDFSLTDADMREIATLNRNLRTGADPDHVNF